MIKAEDAYKQSKIIINNKINDEMNMIEKEITTAIGEGETEIVLYDKLLNSHTKDELKELGYKVITTENGEIGFDTIITWNINI